MSEKKCRMDKERGRTEEKASPTLSGEDPKACANPSGWSRDPFGMESGTRASGFLMQDAENGGYPPTQNGDIRSLFWLFSLMALQN